MARDLNEKQKKFLEVLFDEAGGDIRQAKILAGYNPDYPNSSLIKGLREEIVTATYDFMARNAPKAAFALVSGVDDPTELGMRDKLAAAKELLDRAGVVKTEKMEVEASGGVMLMPPKNNDN